MATIKTLVEETGAPSGCKIAELDAADLPPPEPLRETLSRLADADDDTVLVQYNDRVPQHLYPQLDERGYEYETREGTDDVVTVIWTD